MAVSYKRLWKLLVDKEMSKSDLRKKAEIAPNTMTKLRRGNGRLVRNLIEAAILNQSQRVVNDSVADMEELMDSDFGFDKIVDFDLEKSLAVGVRDHLYHTGGFYKGANSFTFWCCGPGCRGVCE